MYAGLLGELCSLSLPVKSGFDTEKPRFCPLRANNDRHFCAWVRNNGAVVNEVTEPDFSRLWRMVVCELSDRAFLLKHDVNQRNGSSFLFKKMRLAPLPTHHHAPPPTRSSMGPNHILCDAAAPHDRCCPSKCR